MLNLGRGMAGRSRNFDASGIEHGLNYPDNSVSVAAGESVIELKREKRAEENKEQNESAVPRQQSHADDGRDLITRHGFPAATEFAGTSFVTTEHAPTMLCAPTVTPGKTKARAPMNASSPIVILPATRGMSGCEKSCVPALR